jgi:hypothetical protein
MGLEALTVVPSHVPGPAERTWKLWPCTGVVNLRTCTKTKQGKRTMHWVGSADAVGNVEGDATVG